MTNGNADTSIKISNGKYRLKVFCTTFKTTDGIFGWEIKARSFEEAEMICKLINHKLVGIKVAA
jgi:hypothetical protein